MFVYLFVVRGSVTLHRLPGVDQEFRQEHLVSENEVGMAGSLGDRHSPHQSPTGDSDTSTDWFRYFYFILTLLSQSGIKEYLSCPPF